MDPISIAMGLATIAPQILRWLTGSEKAEEAAQVVVDIAKEVTGRSDPLDSLAALKADPSLALEYRKAVMSRETDLDKMYLEDRQNARQRDVEIIKAGRYNYRADLMILGAVTGLISCLVVLVQFKGQMPGEAVGIISTVAGLFGACLKDAFQYEFGSSRGSAQKSEAIEKLFQKGSGLAP